MAETSTLQPAAIDAAVQDDVPQIVYDTLRTPGQPLDRHTQQFMEQRFSHDFSAVRIHTDGRAAASAKALHANAFTIGQDVFWGIGQYTPETLAGKQLLAHELTHVVQQSSGFSIPQTQSITSSRDEASEKEATKLASQVVNGQTVQVKQRPRAIIQGDWLAGAGIGLAAGALVGAGIGFSVGGPVGAAIGAILGAGIGALFGGLVQSTIRRGTWHMAQVNHDGPNYSSDVNISFTPDPTKVECGEIAFVQTVKFSDRSTHRSVETIPNYVQRRTATGWTLDRIDQRSYGWYGYNNNGRPNGNVHPGSSPTPLIPARLHDEPRDVRPNSSFEFETAAICRSGTNANMLYGCFFWGFDVDNANHLTSHSTRSSNSPSSEFAASVRQWNIQAAGPAATRNAPAQRPLGPFTEPSE